MDIKLYHNSSPNNKIGKTLNSETTFTGSFRDSTKVANNLTGFNYAYIPAFNRYYYIENIESYRTGLWLIRLKVDVLESYKDEIKSLDCVIEATEGYAGDNYLSDSVSWVTKVKAKTDILTFSNGLLDNGEYILITAGG